ncbi:hypothetical protein MIMGU_mgv11b024287mg [Erythranthe guttata]|uniref:Uncharacterized protein n=1 Tax=Erythranthe guttata TaxID=4155 RepID=A0A022QUQ5_ERYGU|nr:hypothetical protein MIMGU_mgv11b024287mg [Erythranthe guttata]
MLWCYPEAKDRRRSLFGAVMIVDLAMLKDSKDLRLKLTRKRMSKHIELENEKRKKMELHEKASRATPPSRRAAETQPIGSTIKNSYASWNSNAVKTRSPERIRNFLQQVACPDLFTRSCITASSTVSAGSLADLSNLANTSIYGFEDYHGVDIGVVRGVRLWFSALAGEIPVEIKINDTDTKLGFTIRRTEEGFIYISSVVEADNPSERSGLSSLYKQASLASRLLVVSRISNRKVLPVAIIVHVFLWDRRVNYANVGSIRARAMSTSTSSPPNLGRPVNQSQVVPLEVDDQEDLEDDYEIEVSDEPDITLERNNAGEFSFRLRDFGLTDNCV